jgi:hypothetical protein
MAQQLWSEGILERDWVPALLGGLKRANYRGNPPSINVAFYGHFFRKPGTMAAQALPSVEDRVDPEEQELILEWWHEAARVDATVIPPEAATMARTPRPLQRALNALSQSRFFSGMSDLMILLFAKQVHHYTHDLKLRSAIRECVAAEISDDTRVVVAHSLGSVVAYESLCAHPEWPVRSLVTLGSPLGIRNIIFDRLEPTPVKGLGAWPVGLQRWTNVADAGDVVALQKKLSPFFGPRVRDLAVNNESRAHDVAPYLTAAETGRAIAEGLELGHSVTEPP